MKIIDESKLVEATYKNLWEHWFERGGDPYTADFVGDIVCFFCGANKGSKHEPGCEYVVAKTLLEIDRE